MDETKQPGVQIDQVILLNAEFSHGDKALSLPASTRITNLNFNIETRTGAIESGKAAFLAVRATTDPEGDTEYLYRVSVEVVMVVSAIPGQENLPPVEYVQQMGPAAVYPFVREAVANLTMKGRFGSLWLKPFNFRANPSVPVAAETRQPEPV
jgi:preprotein translocase subunit SecB